MQISACRVVAIFLIAIFWAFMLEHGLAQSGPRESNDKANPATDITWVIIPSGRFLMGSQVPADKLAKDFAEYGREADYFSDEYPQHPVEITNPFLIASTEVTVGQFRAFTEETGYKTRAEVDSTGGWGYDPALRKCLGRDPRFSWLDPGYPQTDSHPVVNVTWEDCQAYCRWLSGKQRRIVRLPTEAEWEYANRAGTKDYYSVGNTKTDILSKARTLVPRPETIRQAVQDLEIDPSESPPFPVPVASYAPNLFGVYDMHGNVWEWTADWHDEKYYSYSPTKDPQGPKQGVVKVRRGGAWNSFPLWARSSFRNWNTIDTRCVNLGFRLVAEMTPWEIQKHEKDRPIRLLFVGDIMLDNGPGHAIASGTDPFEHCSQFLLDADVTIGNLECVLGRGGQQVNKPYIFRGAQGSENYLKKYFHALSVANNHTLDFGPDGLLECLDVLKKADVGYFGGGDDIDSARSGLMLEVRGKRIVLLGYNDFQKKNYQATESRAGNAPFRPKWAIEDIEYAKKTLNADIVIPYIHWGSEMVPMPGEREQLVSKRLIDAGATAVIGAHPHVVQTVDSYRGRPIVYSLGNFVFDYYPVDPPIWYGWAVRLSVPPEGPIEWETIAVELDPRGLPHPIVVE
jgi:formylglycine-generating enzyme required for sulfatase activity